MIILGVALLAACTLIGAYIGDLLGGLLHVKANVGGVGIAMILLIAARVWLKKHGRLSKGVLFGVEFWAGLYIPIVVAMAAQQNVVAAASGGPIVIIAALGSLVLCFACVALLSRFGRTEQDDRWSEEAEHAGHVIGGEAEVAPDAPKPTPEHAGAVPAGTRG